jgi:zinc-binding in reverse transcriptase
MTITSIRFAIFFLDPLFRDSIRWRWTSNDIFTVHSLYDWLQYGGIPDSEFVSIWNTKMPLKIQFFLWLVKRNKILTKVNLKKKGWLDSTQCVFCSAEESSDHLSVTCPFINFIWQWIARHNFFNFQGTNLHDLWNLDFNIPLKDPIVVETVRGALL